VTNQFSCVAAHRTSRFSAPNAQSSFPPAYPRGFVESLSMLFASIRMHNALICSRKVFVDHFASNLQIAAINSPGTVAVKCSSQSICSSFRGIKTTCNSQVPSKQYATTSETVLRNFGISPRECSSSVAQWFFPRRCQSELVMCPTMRSRMIELTFPLLRPFCLTCSIFCRNVPFHDSVLTSPCFLYFP
jgi:hypothetical protein